MCSSTSACATSSSVARKLVTSVCGRLRMKPTVSDNRTLRRLGSSMARSFGSSVANIFGDCKTCAPVSWLKSVLLPALV